MQRKSANDFERHMNKRRTPLNIKNRRLANAAPQRRVEKLLSAKGKKH
jgi:hypothetical protein